MNKYLNHGLTTIFYLLLSLCLLHSNITPAFASQRFSQNVNNYVKNNPSTITIKGKFRNYDRTPQWKYCNKCLVQLYNPAPEPDTLLDESTTASDGYFELSTDTDV